jgi:sensor histidine kinase YesM
MFIKPILKQKAKNGLHVLFWALSYYILLNVFGYESVFSNVDYLYCFLFHLFLVPAVYISIYYIFPITGKKKRWGVYLTLNGILVLVLSWLNISFFNNWSAVLFTGYYFISYFSMIQVALIISIYIVISTLLKLSKSWFLLNDLQRKLLEAEKEKMDIELRGLRAQINPHFFFNTLNGLYALSLQNNPALPSSILQLSGLMRYFIYDSKSERVSLDKEVAMIRDYIGLMKLRTEAETPILFDITGDTENHYVAPLIFISFIENAFKHGLHSENNLIKIYLEMIIDEDKINFNIKNRKGNALNEQFKNSGGIGLENVKRRLSLLYPGKHELKIHEDENLFEVELEIDTR